MDDEAKKMPGFNSRLHKLEVWVEEHQKKSIRHTIYFGVVAFVVGCLVVHSLV